MHDDTQTTLSRRRMLQSAGAGFGLLGLAGSLQSAGMLGATAASASEARPHVIGPHFAPKAKRVIFLFMNGAPSHVDTFDPKPALATHEGEEPPGEAPNRTWRGAATKKR